MEQSTAVVSRERAEEIVSQDSLENFSKRGDLSILIRMSKKRGMYMTIMYYRESYQILFAHVLQVEIISSDNCMLYAKHRGILEHITLKNIPYVFVDKHVRSTISDDQDRIRLEVRGIKFDLPLENVLNI